MDLLDKGYATIHHVASVVGSERGTWQAILLVEVMLHALVLEALICLVPLVSPKSG